jgi:hypothetical protein
MKMSAYVAHWLTFAVSLFISFGFIALGIFGFHQSQLFQVESCPTLGIVETRTENVWTGRYSQHHQLYLAYSYQIGGKKYAVPPLGVSWATWTSFPVSAQIPIIYLRDSPGSSRINIPSEIYTAESAPWFALVLGAILLVISFTVLKVPRKNRST